MKLVDVDPGPSALIDRKAATKHNNKRFFRSFYLVLGCFSLTLVGVQGYGFRVGSFRWRLFSFGTFSRYNRMSSKPAQYQSTDACVFDSVRPTWCCSSQPRGVGW
jgi:hypothetical protein